MDIFTRCIWRRKKASGKHKKASGENQKAFKEK
jgi:hypothetical protein